MKKLNSALRFAADRLVFSFAAVILLAGCGGSISIQQGSSTSTSGALKGILRGGQFPVTSAQVQLYAVGSSIYGSGAQGLLSPAVTTDQDGEFEFTSSQYTCPSDSTLTYLVATGGDPGIGSNNPAIALMAPLGPCGSISSISFVNMNEVTTVASVWALAPFLGPGAQVGSPSSNAQGLANAFANVNNIVDITTGASPGPTAPATATIPFAKIYTLANILATCINSDGTTDCKPLLTSATPSGGSAPTNTIDAALNIAHNPGANVAALFASSSPTAPFSPALVSAPPDWTLAVTYAGGGMDYPTSIAVDAVGNVWVANDGWSNSPSGSVSEFSSTGQPLSPDNFATVSGRSVPIGFTDGTLWENFGLAIDLSGNVWVTNQQSPSVNGNHGSVSELNSSGEIVSTAGGYYGGGVFFPMSVAADTDGSVWVANEGDSTVSKLSSSGTAISASGGWGSGEGLAGPISVAIDASHNAWFANAEADSGSVTGVAQDGSQFTTIACGGSDTMSLATDAIGISTGTSKGHLWTSNYSTSSVSELKLNSNGTATVISTGYTGGGVSYPEGIAVDGAGNVWVANHGGNSVSELQGADGSNPGQAISSARGYGTDASLREPYGIALDASGDVWVANFGLSTLTQFLGAGTPVKTPLVGPAQLP
jgi:sugar lactone lactonase YvrE